MKAAKKTWSQLAYEEVAVVGHLDEALRSMDQALAWLGDMEALPTEMKKLTLMKLTQLGLRRAELMKTYTQVREAAGDREHHREEKGDG